MLQFRQADQRPGTPLFAKLKREFAARCAAEEQEKQQRLAAAVASKRAPIPKVLQRAWDVLLISFILMKQIFNSIDSGSVAALDLACLDLKNGHIATPFLSMKHCVRGCRHFHD